MCVEASQSSVEERYIMPEVSTIDLRNRVPGGASIQFLSAEVPEIEDPPVALIRYALAGEQPPTGLRLDLNKQVFLDHFAEGSAKEKVLEGAAPQIIQMVYAKLDEHEGVLPEGKLKASDDRFEFEDDSPIVELPRHK
jgi:hypothetical protein